LCAAQRLPFQATSVGDPRQFSLETACGGGAELATVCAKLATACAELATACAELATYSGECPAVAA